MAPACCKSKPTVVMYTVNAILLIFGIAVTSVAGAAVGRREDVVKAMPSFGATASMGAVYLALIAGIFLILLTLMGIGGAYKGEKCCGKTLLAFYGIFLFIIMLLFIIVVGITFSLSNAFLEMKGRSMGDPSLTKPQFDILRVANSTFFLCCPKGVPNHGDVCQFLSDVVTAGTCAAGLPVFQDKLLDLMSGIFRGVGSVSAVILTLLLIVFVASCFLLWRDICCKNARRAAARLDDDEDVQASAAPLTDKDVHVSMASTTGPDEPLQEEGALTSKGDSDA